MPLLLCQITPPKLTPSAVIDIAVVALLVYEALMIVRGTRAGHILLGILIMLALYVGAIWGRLEALRSVLSYIVPYTALAIIVLFQSEIRRTLDRLGRKRWLGRGFRRPESTDEVLMALKRLSERKIGALIVMERDIGLRTFIESGVRLEAQLTRDLLLSIKVRSPMSRSMTMSAPIFRSERRLRAIRTSSVDSGRRNPRPSHRFLPRRARVRRISD